MRSVRSNDDSFYRTPVMFKEDNNDRRMESQSTKNATDISSESSSILNSELKSNYNNIALSSSSSSAPPLISSISRIHTAPTKNPSSYSQEFVGYNNSSSIPSRQQKQKRIVSASGTSDRSDLASVESAGSGVAWLLNTFCKENSIDTVTNSDLQNSLSLDALDNPWIHGNKPLSAQQQQNLPFINMYGRNNHQDNKNDLEGVLVLRRSILPPRSLVNSPYVEHKRINMRMKHLQQMQLLQQQQQQQQQPPDSAPSSLPSPTPGIAIPPSRSFPFPNTSTKSPWSTQPPVSHLFDKVQSNNIHDKQMKKILRKSARRFQEQQDSNLLRQTSAGGDNNIPAHLMRAVGLEGPIPTSSPEKGKILVSSMYEMFGESILGDSSETKDFGPEDNDSIGRGDFDRELFLSKDHDPLYRIMCQEAERSETEDILQQKIPSDIIPLAAAEGSRRALAQLAALSSSMMRAHEITVISQFTSVPPQIFLTARVVYFFIVFYHELMISNLVDIGPCNFKVLLRKGKDNNKNKRAVTASNDPPSRAKSRGGNRSPGTSPSKSILADKLTKDIEKEQILKKMTDEKYIEYLRNRVDMEFFWSIVSNQRKQYGIETFSTLRLFSWEFVKSLCEFQEEMVFALYLIEKGGRDPTSEYSNNNNNSNNNPSTSFEDMYTIFPESMLPILREAVKPQIFHSNSTATMSPAAARLCSWARRVVAGIYTVKQASMRIPLPLEQDRLLLLHPSIADGNSLYGSVALSEDAFDQSGNDNNTYITASAATSGSLLAHLDVDSHTSHQRLEQVVSYRPITSLGLGNGIHGIKTQPTLNVLRIVIAVDGSSISHASFLAGMTLGRPLDGIDILAVPKPKGGSSIFGGTGGPAALSALRSHYEELIHNISNSPSHRVLYCKDLPTTSNNADSSSSKRPKSVTVSFSSSSNVTSNLNTSDHEMRKFERDEVILLDDGNDQVGDISANPIVKQVNGSSLYNSSDGIAISNLTPPDIDYDGVEGLLIRALATNSDLCILGLGWGRSAAASVSGHMRQLRNDKIRQFLSARRRPFATVLTNTTASRNLSPTITRSSSANANNNFSPQKSLSINFAPSRFVVCITKSPASRAAFSLTRSLAKPCDLIFLIHLSISDSANNNAIASASGNTRGGKLDPAISLANALVSEYKLLGHNLHVEPLSLPPGISPSQRQLIIAGQLRRTAMVFEPTFVVMGADAMDILNVTCGVGVGVGGENNNMHMNMHMGGVDVGDRDRNKRNVENGVMANGGIGSGMRNNISYPASLLEDDDSVLGGGTIFDRPLSLIEAVVCNGGGVEDMDAISAPPFSYVLTVANK